VVDYNPGFDVLLTVNFSIFVSVINQLDAQTFGAFFVFWHLGLLPFTLTFT